MCDLIERLRISDNDAEKESLLREIDLLIENLELKLLHARTALDFITSKRPFEVNALEDEILDPKGHADSPSVRMMRRATAALKAINSIS